MLWVGNDAFPRRAFHVEGLGWFQRVVLLDDEDTNFNESAPWQSHGLNGGIIGRSGVVGETSHWGLSLKRAYSLSSVSWVALVHCGQVIMKRHLWKWSWSSDHEATSESMSQDKPFKFFIEVMVVPVTKVNNPYLSVQNLDFTASTQGFKVLA